MARWGDLGVHQIVRAKVGPRVEGVPQMRVVKAEQEGAQALPVRRGAHQQRPLAQGRWNSHPPSMLD